MRHNICYHSLVLVLVLFSGASWAGTYPTRNPRMIVPYAPGGGTDIMARAVAQFMETPLGRRVVVVNKPGGMGSIGTAEVAEARPDGYTIIMLSSADFVVTPLFVKDPGYKYDDFQIVARFNDTANCLIVKKDSQFKTFKELVDFAKENPGKVTVSTSGDAHLLLGILIEQETGIKLSFVGFGGGGESLNALLGGHVEAALIDKRFIQQAEQSGCKALGVASDQRFDTVAPDCPTFVEMGYNITDNATRLLAVPAQTPNDVVDVLTQAVLSFANGKEFEERLTSLGEVRKIATGAEVTDFVKEQIAIFSHVVESNRDKIPLK
ncbi:MAG: tripartite tricarboxylate transporter substrate binding protein [Planctomycetes bacterium]|nr:tripartite tricarboxylate transporter substrate binding protein [Planctomycetota bacterium]